MNQGLIFGCFADDFTGASDAASFLVKGGLNTILYNGIPDKSQNVENGIDAVVIAHKIRSVEKEVAVQIASLSDDTLKNMGAHHTYYKYCSTFDSTPRGNIGPVMDLLLEKNNIQYSILCPALPVNGRTVKDGHLFVNGIPLHESSMKNHPITPMWDSNIANLMKDQSKYKCMIMTKEIMKLSEVELAEQIRAFAKENEHFYIIPDYNDDEDEELIVKHFSNMKVLSGGSGILMALAKKYAGESQINRPIYLPGTKGKCMILAGSCSEATLEQIEYYQDLNKYSYKINLNDLVNNNLSVEDIWESLDRMNDVLIYTSEPPDKVKENQQKNKENVSELIERTLSELAEKAVQSGYFRIVVAGGETSGAIIKKLDYSSYHILESIAPGVPIMVPLQNTDIRLVLKSGNFGKKDFFVRAIEMTGGK